MSTTGLSLERVNIVAENIGGIDETEVEFAPGITLLKGRNATNRTSLLQAIMAACGSRNVSLKADADEGSVEMTISDGTYSRRLVRSNGMITFKGDPYLEDPTVADHFAFLLESNQARRAVVTDEDLRDLIMEPVDTDAIQQEIEALEADKRALDEEIEELDSLAKQLPQLEEQKTQLQVQIEDKQENLDAKETKLDETNADIEQHRDEKAELEEKFEILRETRSELENTRYRIETEEESIEALEEEYESLQDEKETLSEHPDADIAEMETQLEELKGREDSIESDISQLQSIIQFNEEMLEGTNPDIATAMRDDNHETDADALTDQLMGDTVVCWTCGTEVQVDQIEATLDRLRDHRTTKVEERNTVRLKIKDIDERRTKIEEAVQERNRLERQLDQIDQELDERKKRLPELQEEREHLVDEIEHLETEINGLESDDHSELLELHKEANQLEFEIESLETDLDETRDEIKEIERQLDRRSDLESERKELQSKLEELRTRIEDLEREAIEEFNTHMDEVLEILDYENIERIWLERTEKSVREGSRSVTKSQFDLHVIRSSGSGRTYEDTVDHLSESEREVMGLIFALAGYLTHGIHEELPFMLLDSLEAIDATRLAQLIRYFAEYATFLIVALLPEDAANFEGDHRTIENI